MANIGLDIGSSYIKVAKVSGDKVEMASVIPNKLGKANLESEQDVLLMTTELKEFFGTLDLSPSKIRIVIPEGIVYTRVIQMPSLSQAELSNAIKYEAEQYVPVSLAEVELSYEVVSRQGKGTDDEKMQVLLVASPNKYLNQLVNVMSKLSIEPEYIEPEAIATARIVIMQKAQPVNTMLLTLGAVTSSISIFSGQDIIFAHRIDTGSAAFTRAIATSLSLPVPQAEEYKRSYGVKSDVLEGKLKEAVAPLTNNLISEIKKAFSFVVSSNLNTKPTRLVVSGGGSLLPGLIQLLSQNTGLEVTSASLSDMKKSKDITFPDQVIIAAVGAAYR